MSVRPALLAIVVGLFAGCAQTSSRPAETVEPWPQVTFVFDAGNASLRGARVLVDGDDAGPIADFAEGRGALKVPPGVRIIKVVSSTGIVLDVRTRLRDGVTRPFALR
ncbi:MAG: hypothetical protein ABI641_05870 [Caldimonas sp.]